MRRNGFTLIEILVVISIIAILIALLLPTLARARSLALQIQCASNMRQIGIAMNEYANEYRGKYPLSDTVMWPMGTYAGWDSTNNFWVNYPVWGFGLLYYDSYGVQGTSMVNPRPGILTPSPLGLSLMYSTQSGGFTQNLFFPASDYTNGIATNWSNSYSGYCYWLDRDKNTYTPGEDQPGVGNGAVSSYVYLPDYYTTDHIPAASPLSNPGSILVTDEVFYQGPASLRGLADWPTLGVPSSDHVLTSDNFLPVGSHELYNDGAVVWQPMSQIHPRMTIQAGLVMGW